MEMTKFEEKTSTEDMDPQSFELYCILMLIKEYEEEKDEKEKETLKREIGRAVYDYRHPEEPTRNL